MNTRYHILLLIMLLIAAKAGAQIKVAENKQLTATGVIIHADPRLAVLEKKQKNVQLGVIRSGRGFRVQIYNGNDRVKAMATKMDFMKRFPTVRTYLTYVQPQYRIKVGDFRSRQDAQKFYEQVSTIYSPCMIVPDIIVINTLRDD